MRIETIGIWPLERGVHECQAVAWDLPDLNRVNINAGSSMSLSSKISDVR
jgi:hypothetical protein